MGKYEPLAERLRGQRQGQWTASFTQIEKVLGFPLPASARTYREWWANQRDGGHSQTKGWQDAGWQVWKVDLGSEQVIFRRSEAARSSQKTTLAEEAAELMERASQLLGTTDRDQIVSEALRALIQREAARRLARLGGTMSGFTAPPRRQPA